MAAIEMNITGLDALKARIQNAAGRISDEVSRELYTFGAEVMEASKMVVPVDTGALMNTGKVFAPTQEGHTITMLLGYGDESAKYALFVHENMNPNVNWSRPGSGPRYLALPLQERQDQLPGRITDAAKRAFQP